ncbi:MAG: carbonic anhydrase family protein [Bacteroidia bacterium]
MKKFMKTTCFQACLMLTLFSLVFTACKEPGPEPDACALANEHNEWGYDDFGGPECWGAVCSEGHCFGDAQSPVNITGWVTSSSVSTISYSPANTKANIVHNGHTIQFNMDPGTFCTMGKTFNNLFNDFTLGQFHFHVNSEHQINGAYAPMEMHMVHRNIWEDKYLVVSLMFKEGAENPFLKRFIPHIPASNTQSPFVNADSTFSAYDILPQDKDFYTYQGSLTTPPCTEVVTWAIFENQVEASVAQIEAIAALLPENFRPIQPLNSRTISHVQY